MPLIVGHAFVGASVVAALTGSGTETRNDRRRLILLGAMLGALPDLDLFFTWILGLGIKWHGGFTHSMTLAMLLGWLVARFTDIPSVQRTLVLFGAMFSHGLLDWATKKTYGGTQLFWPFTRTRYKAGLFDYFAFYPDSKLDPVWKLILRALEISFYELVIFGGVFLLIITARKAWSTRRSARLKGKEMDIGVPTE